MTGHDVLVAASALTFIAAGLTCLGTVRYLGPTEYAGKRSAPWPTRLFYGLGFLALMWRGLSILFPGEAASSANLSPSVLPTALICLWFAIHSLDMVRRDRSPPPIFPFLHEPRDELEPVGHAVRHGSLCGHRTRVMVVAAATAVLVVIAGVLTLGVVT